MKKFFFLLFASLFVVNSYAQKAYTKAERLKWFENAKLGIFMHWGLYSVDGITASWPLKHKQISWSDYVKQAKGFTAKNYHPEEWAQLFKEIGAQYVVLTAKHHDGFALWPTRFSKFNAADFATAKRDLIAPYAKAMRKEGLKVGLYFSLIDWSHKDYHVNIPRPAKELNKLYPQPGWQKHLTPHERFIDFMFGQIAELSQKYHPDLFWFDGGWEHHSEWWHAEEIKDSLLKWIPKVVVNSRLPGYGDYSTPEQGIPVTRPEDPWELCMTINDHWAYVPSDTNYKPVAQIIRTFTEVISQGGNLLLDIGPEPDGTLPEIPVKILKEFGQWINRNKEAIFHTQAGLLPGHFYGPTLLSKDGKTLYLAVYDTPKDFIELKGLRTKIKDIRVIGSNEKLNWVRNGGAPWKKIPGIVRIAIPQKENLDKYVTFIAVDLDGALDVYRGNN
jgi:alpha-L-fucosidase